MTYSNAARNITETWKVINESFGYTVKDQKTPHFVMCNNNAIIKLKYTVGHKDGFFFSLHNFMGYFLLW